MTKLRPDDKFPDWKSHSALQRMMFSAGALYLHGFMSDSERRKVQERLQKWARTKQDGTPRRSKHK